MRFVNGWIGLLVFLALAPMPGALHAQNGDHPGEAQPETVPPHRIPPAPVLTPEEQLRTFRLPPGYRVELVASEPLVSSPVQIQFDHLGRLWVVEMNGYMPNAQGLGETNPIGNIVILEDTDADGRMDRRTVFLDGLVMPRSLLLHRDGALVAEPPNLWYCADTNRDGICDQRTLVATNYAPQNDPRLGRKSNPEHASNGLLQGLDNWIYSANHTTRYRHVENRWEAAETPFRGQWGLSQDDDGRLHFNSNSDHHRADLVPAHYLARNRNDTRPFGANVQLARDQSVSTARVNPGVNRGYQPRQLTPDGHLATFTGACGPCVYRGDQFPEAHRGLVFLCEPTGNFIRANRLVEAGDELIATNAFAPGEFLTSTDERFRPVNLANGPDGGLYIVDMARGLIQHHIYLTSYLRKQIESRNLQAPVNLGRIYRVVHDSVPRPRPRLLKDRPETDTLVGLLDSPNGWWRDRAQQLLVERADPAAVPALRKLASGGIYPSSPLARMHALHTLDGLRQLDLATLQAALADATPRVRIAALRLCEPLLNGPLREQAIHAIYSRAGFVPQPEQLQLFFTLGEIRTPAADNILRVLLMNGPTSRLRVSAALSSLGGRELEFLESMVLDPACSTGKREHQSLFAGLATCIVQEGDPARIDRLLSTTATCKPGDWQQTALLDGTLALFPAPKPGATATNPKTLRLNHEPRALRNLAGINLPEIQSRVARLEHVLQWPGKAGETTPTPAAASLNPVQTESVERGRELYTIVCGACHQPHGNGQDGLAPPLRDSEWVLGSVERLVRITLHGVREGITVKDKRYELNMPALGEALDDQQIADALTFIRRHWGHEASPVSRETVARIRAATSAREDSWTEAELLKIP